VILDELGDPPFSASGGALLFRLLNKLHGRTGVVMTQLDPSMNRNPESKLGSRLDEETGSVLGENQPRPSQIPFLHRCRACARPDQRQI
jgi:hypothetical protein